MKLVFILVFWKPYFHILKDLGYSRTPLLRALKGNGINKSLAREPRFHESWAKLFSDDEFPEKLVWISEGLGLSEYKLTGVGCYEMYHLVKEKLNLVQVSEEFCRVLIHVILLISEVRVSYYVYSVLNLFSLFQSTKLSVVTRHNQTWALEVMHIWP